MTPFQLWLRESNKRRWVLFDIQHSTGTLKFSNLPYSGYLTRISGDINFSASINLNRFLGWGNESFSSIKLLNVNNDLDSMIDLNSQGYTITVQFGDGEDGSTIGFKTILKGFVGSITAPSKTIIEVKTITNRFFLRQDLKKNFYGSTELLKGEPEPIAYGTCFNITPKKIENGIVNYPGGRWQCNSDLKGQLNITGHGVINVFDDGVPLTEYLGALPVPAGSWQNFVTASPFPNVGFRTGFILGTPPTGVLTCDYFGETNNFGGNNSAKSVIKTILVNTVPTPSPTVLTPSSVSSPPQETTNYYIKDSQSAEEAIGKLATGTGSFVVFNGNGDLVYGNVSRPDSLATAPIINLDESDIYDGSFRFIRQVSPFNEVSFQYFKNWTTQDKSTIIAGFEARNSRLNSEWVTRKLSGGSASFKLSTKAQAIQSYIHGHNYVDDNAVNTNWGVDIATLENLVSARDFQPGYLFTLQTNALSTEAFIGDKIQIKFPRFGFENGRNVAIVGMNYSLATKSVVSLVVFDIGNNSLSFGRTSKTKFGTGFANGNQGNQGKNQEPIV